MKRPTAARTLAWLVGPHLALGGWLALVPDHAAFEFSQGATIAHVSLALLTLPWVAWAMWHHARVPHSDGAFGGAAGRRWAKYGLTAALLSAYISGFWLLRGLDGSPAQTAHAAAAWLILLPLLAHLMLARRWGWAVALGVVAAALPGAGTLTAPWWGLDAPEPVSPAFSADLKPLDAYDSAQWCGSCHEQNYAEWERSTHGRAMKLPKVREEFALPGSAPNLALDLAAIGGAAHGAFPVSELRLDSCPACHAPTSFYGNDPTPVLKGSGTVAEGVTCSFCHTLRGRREPGPPARLTQALTARDDSAARLAGVAGMPYYISAPESVRRYWFQAANDPWSRWLGDQLIRWRPEVHRRDYHTAFLDTSEACQGCHGLAMDSPLTPHKSFYDWERSTFHSKDPERNVTCQDCHMVAKLTGKVQQEPGRLVPYGPVRPQRRSHFFLGGNARAAHTMNDADLAEREHDYAVGAVALRVRAATQTGRRVTLTVEVESKLVGHRFPAYETQNRLAWLRAIALSADGRGQASVKGNVESAVPDPLVFFRWSAPGMSAVLGDTTLLPLETRTVPIVLDLPPGETADTVTVELSQNFDTQPLHIVKSKVLLQNPTGTPLPLQPEPASPPTP